MKLLFITCVSFQTTTDTLFIDPSEDPFLDHYIETISHMNKKDIMAIPKMNDTEFVRYLFNDNDAAARGIQLRVDTSVFDPLRDNQLIHQTDIDEEWETLMVSGPIVVGYMGNLMVIASKKDFSFHAPSGYVYRYIRYPNSFRATLAQVSTEMTNALMGAHTAMDRIQLSIKQVPTHVKTALKLITSASDAMLKSMLPRTLESVGRLATESASIANSTVLQFNQLQDLLTEIIELSASTQSTNEADIERMKEQRKNATLEQERLKENLAAIKNQYNQSKSALETARKNYAEAMAELSASSTPTIIPARMVPLPVISSAIGLVVDGIKAIGCIFGKCADPAPTVDNTKFENAMKVAELAKKELERAEEIHNQHFLLQLAEQNELAKTMNSMALLDLSQLSTEEVVQLLLKATEQISLIKEQWIRMIIFFSTLAAKAHNTQQRVVNDFVDFIQQAQHDNLLINQYEREFFVELLIPCATDIESGAHLLFVMAKTYYAVSSEHMINQIAGINKLSVLQTDEARHTQLQLASNNTMITSLKVSQLAQKRHELYLEETQNRQAEYTTYMNNLVLFQLEETIG
ncbi:unnamed protein product [Adineta steineri]|uniref:Uncharacterized protein n=1 Tax=Adineta steineri TaxID=433720 RepID=A0A814YAA8_9BILA|nr:unnamed protein product [Adineta steineri]CAF1226524.1 unnamed protein product [Adineta steineri]